MSAEYATPLRLGYSPSNIANGSNSSRRVVRSALELLMDTASPDIAQFSVKRQQQKPSKEPTPSPPLRGREEQSQSHDISTAAAASAGSLALSSSLPAQQRRGFTVTYAGAQPPRAASAGGSSSLWSQAPQSQQQQVPSNYRTGLMDTAGEEPSALEFMAGTSRSHESVHHGSSTSDEGSKKKDVATAPPQKRGNSSAHRFSLFSEGTSSSSLPLPHDVPLHHDDAHDSNATRSRSNEKDGQAHGPATTRRAPVTKATAPALRASLSSPASYSPPDPSRSLAAEVELAGTGSGEWTPEAAAQGPATFSVPPRFHMGSVDSGAGNRDDGDDDAARDVEHEEGDEGERVLFTETEVRRHVQVALETYEQQRDAGETEILAHVTNEMEQRQQEHEMEMALLKAAAQRDSTQLQSQLRAVVTQCESLQVTNDELLSGRRDLEESLRAATMDADRLREEVAAMKMDRAAYEEDCGDIRSRMTALGTCMTSMESAITEKDATIAQLRARVKKAEAQAQDEKNAGAQLEGQLKASEEALQKQTDEVRRRMQRITALEVERSKLTEELQRVRGEVLLSFDQQALVREVLDQALAAVRHSAKVAAAAAITATRRTDVTHSLESKLLNTSSQQHDCASFSVSLAPCKSNAALLAASLSPDTLDRTRSFEASDVEEAQESETRSTSCSHSEGVDERQDTASQPLAEKQEEEMYCDVSIASPPQQQHRSRSADVCQRCTGPLFPDSSPEVKTKPVRRVRSTSPRYPSVTNATDIQRSSSGSGRGSAVMAGGTYSIRRSRQTYAQSSSLSTNEGRGRRRAQQRDASVSREEADLCLKDTRRSYASCVRAAQLIEAGVRDLCKATVRRVSQLHDQYRAQQLRKDEALTGEQQETQKLTEACKMEKIRVRQLEAQLQEVRTECDLRGKDLVTLDTERQRLRAELAALMTQATERAAAALETKETLALRVQSLEEELLVKEEAHAVLSGRLATVEAEFTETRERLNALQASTAAQTAEALQVSAKEQAKLTRLTERLSKMCEEKEEVAAELATTSARLKAEQTQLHAMRERQQGSRLRDEKVAKVHAQQIGELKESLAAAEALRLATSAADAEDKAHLAKKMACVEAQLAGQQEKITKYRRRAQEVMREAALGATAERATLETVLSITAAQQRGSASTGEECDDARKKKGKDVEKHNSAHDAAKALFTDTEHHSDSLGLIRPRSKSTRRHRGGDGDGDGAGAFTEASPAASSPTSSAWGASPSTPNDWGERSGHSAPVIRVALDAPFSTTEMSGQCNREGAMTGNTMTSTELRRRAVASVQSVVLEVARLRETAKAMVHVPPPPPFPPHHRHHQQQEQRQGFSGTAGGVAPDTVATRSPSPFPRTLDYSPPSPRTRSADSMESFKAAEEAALEAARLSAARKGVFYPHEGSYQQYGHDWEVNEGEAGKSQKTATTAEEEGYFDAYDDAVVQAVTAATTGWRARCVAIPLLQQPFSTPLAAAAAATHAGQSSSKRLDHVYGSTSAAKSSRISAPQPLTTERYTRSRRSSTDVFASHAQLSPPSRSFFVALSASSPAAIPATLPAASGKRAASSATRVSGQGLSSSRDRSTTTGEVDGSCSPARPPALHGTLVP